MARVIAARDRAPQSVETIQADGDELEYILDRFINIPCNKRQRVHTWTGDIARTIVSKLFRQVF